MDQNPEPSKRRWFVFSLKSVLLLMLVIGAFLAGWKACEMEYRLDAKEYRLDAEKYRELRQRLRREMDRPERVFAPE